MTTAPAGKPGLNPCLRCNGSGTEAQDDGSVPVSGLPMGRDGFRTGVYRLLRPKRVSDQVIDRIFAAFDSATAQMIEDYARPDDRWGPR